MALKAIPSLFLRLSRSECVPGFKALLGLLSAFVFTGCPPLGDIALSSTYVEMSEIGHQKIAVFTDSADMVAVFDESYSRNCSGVLLECESFWKTDHRFSIYLSDLRDANRRDTLVPTGEAQQGSRIPPITPVYYSFRKGRLVYGLQDTTRHETEWRVADSRGSPLFAVSDLPRFRDEPIHDCLPSPGFDRLAVILPGPLTNTIDSSGSSFGRIIKLFHLSLEDGALLDSLVIVSAPEDTGSPTRRIRWESDSTLMIYSELGFGYRVRENKVVETRSFVRCVGRRTLSSEISAEGRKVEWKDAQPVLVDAGVVGCLGYRP